MITVVVPVYNMGRYLPHCVDSLLKQTYPDYEILLVDDGSTDGSGDVCREQAQRSVRIRVIHKANGGLSSARNCGIDNARGECIIFPDPDDWVEPDYLESLLNLRTKAHADLSICGFYRFNQNKEQPFHITSGILDTKEALRRLVRASEFSGYTWNKLFDMNIIRRNQLRFDETLTSIQDLHFCFRFFEKCRLIAVEDKPLYHYNIASGVSALQAPVSQRRLDAFLAYEKLAELAKDSPCPELEQAEYARMFELSMKYLYPYFHNTPRDKEVLRLLKDNLKKYKDDFFAVGGHSWRFNLMARVALVSPQGYYYLMRATLKLSSKI